MKTKRRALIILVIIFLIAAIAVISACLYSHIREKKEEAENLRLIKEYYSSKLALYEAENEEYGEYEIDVAFLGDSLTDAYDLNCYYPSYKVANRGIGGETTHGLEERLKVSLYDLKPRAAVILIGGNNLDTMFENYEDMLISIKENLPETKIILCSLTAMGGKLANKNQIAAYNNVIIKKLAEKYGFGFVDLYSPLFDERSGEIFESYTSDGAHLTDEGYRVLTDAITPEIDKILAK